MNKADWLKLLAGLIFGGASGSLITYWLTNRRLRIEQTRAIIADLKTRLPQLAQLRGLLQAGPALGPQQKNDVIAMADEFNSIAGRYYAKSIDQKLFTKEVQKNFMCEFWSDLQTNGQFRNVVTDLDNLRRYCDEQ